MVMASSHDQNTSNISTMETHNGRRHFDGGHHFFIFIIISTNHWGHIPCCFERYLLSSV